MSSTNFTTSPRRHPARTGHYVVNHYECLALWRSHTAKDRTTGNCRRCGPKLVEGRYMDACFESGRPNFSEVVKRHGCFRKDADARRAAGDKKQRDV
jgi:hypothetical protein